MRRAPVPDEASSSLNHWAGARALTDQFKATLPTPSTIALCAGLLIQTAGIVWWGAHIDQRMSAVEEKVNATAGAAETIARLDERTSGLVTTVNRIDARLNAQDDANLASRK